MPNHIGRKFQTVKFECPMCAAVFHLPRGANLKCGQCLIGQQIHVDLVEVQAEEEKTFRYPIGASAN